MIRILGATFIAILLCGAAAPPPSPSNEAQIHARADEFAAAWNKHDPTAMAYFWSVDGDLINPFGRKAKGLTEIQRLFQDEQNGPMKNSTFRRTGWFWFGKTSLMHRARSQVMKSPSIFFRRPAASR